MIMADIEKYLVENKERCLYELVRLISFASYKGEKSQMSACAEYLAELMKRIGITVEIINTPGEPFIFGSIESQEKAPTILFYGHYDVKSPEPLEEWNSPPFEATISQGRVYGRGAGDNKGQLLAHLFAVQILLKIYGKLPINVKFLFEGGEEDGSPNLLDFVLNNRELLMADLVYTSDGPRHETGLPIVCFGVRGVLQLELILQTAEFDNHSGNKGGVIPNPAWELVQVLNSMRELEGTIKIPGFYDNIKPPTDEELNLIRNIPFCPKQLARVFGVEEILLNREEYFYRLMFSPTLNINGLVSGYTGTGTKTIIPAKARAKMDARLVPDQDPLDIYEKICQYMHSINPRVKVFNHGYMHPSRTNIGSPVCKIIINAVSAANGQQPIIIPSMGGSLPDYIWTKELGLPSVIVPYANADESNHAPNENITLDCFFQGIRTSARVLYDFKDID